MSMAPSRVAIKCSGAARKSSGANRPAVGSASTDHPCSTQRKLRTRTDAPGLGVPARCGGEGVAFPARREGNASLDQKFHEIFFGGGFLRLCRILDGQPQRPNDNKGGGKLRERTTPWRKDERSFVRN